MIDRRKPAADDMCLAGRISEYFVCIMIISLYIYIYYYVGTAKIVTRRTKDPHK